MNHIAGIDLGSFVIATAICTGHGALDQYLLAEPPKQKPDLALTRLCPLIDCFQQQLLYKGGRIDHVYIEEPIYAGSFKATVAMAMVAGAVVVILENACIPYSFVGNSVWKKAVIGKGNATKDEIRMWAVSRFGIAPDLRQDIYDSIAIAEWGRRNFAKD
jgi:Holliday junction resolvasome RuvABC endonuclease subunit